MTKRCGNGWRIVLATACMFAVLMLGIISPGWTDDSAANNPGSPSIKLNDPIRLELGNELRGPDVVDLDGDGKSDLVSGSYEDRIFVAQQAEGSKSLEFSPEVALRTTDEDVKLNHW